MPNKSYVEFNASQLYEAILKLRDTDECDKLFRDICTVQELAAIAQRYAVARLLSKQVKYADIVEQTGASTATISRVKRSLEDGEGYPLVFTRLDEPRGRKKKN